jgi:hypothetical protein
MKLRLPLIATVLLFGANVAQAQTSALNTLGRHLGWGVSDGYHANRFCGESCAASCSMCQSCGVSADAIHAQPPLAAPMQHTNVGQPVPAMQPWPSAHYGQAHFIPAAAPPSRRLPPPSFRRLPNVAPYVGMPRVFAQPQPMYQPARPTYTPVSAW